MPTPQQPIGSGFGAASTTSDVIAGIDLSGKVAIVPAATRAWDEKPPEPSPPPAPT